MLKLDGKTLLLQLRQTKQDLQKLQEILFNQKFFPNNETKKKKIKMLTNINIRLTANNVFCTLKKQKKILCVGSAGIYKIHISKRVVKSNTKLIISKFLFKIKEQIRFNNLILNIACPKKLKKKILRQILKFRKKQITQHLNFLKTKKSPITLAIKLAAKKCFNGCRPPKKVRKKRRFFRIVKQ